MFNCYVMPKSFKSVAESAISCWLNSPIFPATHPTVDPNPHDLRLLADMFQYVFTFNFTPTTGLLPERIEDIIIFAERFCDYVWFSNPTRSSWIRLENADRLVSQRDLTEELIDLGIRANAMFPELGSPAEAAMKVLFVYSGYISIAKVCRPEARGGIQISLDGRILEHDQLKQKSETNPWIKEGALAVIRHRPKQNMIVNWIPETSPFKSIKDAYATKDIQPSTSGASEKQPDHEIKKE